MHVDLDVDGDVHVDLDVDVDVDVDTSTSLRAAPRAKHSAWQAAGRAVLTVRAVTSSGTSTPMMHCSSPVSLCWNMSTGS